MFDSKFRGGVSRSLRPIVAVLATMHVPPDALTVVGGLGVVGGSLALLARGRFLVGSIVVTLFVLGDLFDGELARATGHTSDWGDFLDSLFDRVADGAVFGAVAFWYARGQSLLLCGVALGCMVASFVVSYVRSKAKTIGIAVEVGLAERAERLILLLLGAFLMGVGVRHALGVSLFVILVATLYTLAQRIVRVYQQTHAA